MILELLKNQLWWVYAIIGSFGVYCALMSARTANFWTAYGIYIVISTLTFSWMFIKSYALAPSFFQPWFLSTAALAIIGFCGSLFYFHESVSVINYIGAALGLVGSAMLIL